MSVPAASRIATSLEAVRLRIRELCALHSRVTEPRLVAVSKLQPLEKLKEAYDVGQRCFGENYVQELVGKAPLMPEDVEWHFIGHLQKNKAKMLVGGVPNLLVETVDTIKVANALNKACVSVGRSTPLGVFVQVNTSGEASKSGAEVEACGDVVSHVVTECENLEFRGLMTIGRFGDRSPECFEVGGKGREGRRDALPSKNM
jgi:PLP dependent protein